MKNSNSRPEADRRPITLRLDDLRSQLELIRGAVAWA